MKIKEKLVKNKAGLSGAVLLAIFLLLLGLAVILVSLPSKKLPEVFEITSACQVYFEIETQADTSNISAGDEIYIDIYLTTSGEEFDAAVAIVEWDENDFSYQNATGLLSSQFLSSFVRDDQGLRALTHFAPRGDPPMRFGNGQRVKFAALTLRALVDNPNSEVRLSSN